MPRAHRERREQRKPRSERQRRPQQVQRWRTVRPRADDDAPHRGPSQPRRFAGDQQRRGEVGRHRQRAERRHAHKARGALDRSRPGGLCAHEADELRQFEDQHQRIHPRGARLRHQHQIDGDQQRGERTGKCGAFACARPAEGRHHLARRCEGEHDGDHAEKRRKRAQRGHPVAEDSDPLMQREVVERKLARIQGGLARRHRVRIRRGGGGPRRGLVGAEVGGAEAVKPQPCAQEKRKDEQGGRRAARAHQRVRTSTFGSEANLCG